MHSYAPVEGGMKFLIFNEQISRDDIEVHFTLDKDKHIMKIWLM